LDAWIAILDRNIVGSGVTPLNPYLEISINISDLIDWTNVRKQLDQRIIEEHLCHRGSIRYKKLDSNLFDEINIVI